MSAAANFGSLCRGALDRLDTEYEIVPYSSAQSLFSALDSGVERFDILCLDICMDGMTGMELAHRLRCRDDRTSIIFITSSDAYLREGYSVRALQYLSKPVDAEALMSVFRDDIRLNHTPRVVTFRRGSHTVAVPISDIRYVESRDHGIYIHSASGEQFFPISLTEAEKLLPHEQFCRCHNSYLVNTSAITEIARHWVTLKGGLSLPIGRHY